MSTATASVPAAAGHGHGRSALNGFREGVETGVRNRARQVQTILQGVSIVIVASLAAVVIAAFNNSTSVNSSNNPELANALDSVNSGFASMLSLVEPLLLVLVAVVIIAVVRRIQ